MALKYLCNLDINNNVLQNMRVFSSGSAPTASIGALYVDTGDSNYLKYYDGSGWITLSSSTGDITGVTAGTGLNGGGSSGTVTLNVDAAQTVITSLLATDIKIGEDDQTKIDFETPDEIHFYAANVEQVYLGDNIFGPQSDSDVDLGSSSIRWKDAYVDSITVTGEVDGASLDISGDADIDGTLEADAITIGGVAIGSIYSPIAGSASIVTTGALNSGSITSGFGNIDNGSSTFSTGAATVASLSVSDGNITNVADIALDSISADGTDINIAVSDNSATALTIKQGSDAYLIIDTANSSESVSIGTGISGTAISIGHGTSEVSFGDNVTVAGNLTVQGTTTTIDSTTVAIGDNMMKYAKDNAANASDIGWYGKIVSTGTKYPGMWYDASEGIGTPTFQLGIATTEPAGTGTIATKGTLNANLTGNVTGALTGNADTVTNGVYTTNNLSVMAATTSAQLAGVISDETGSGALVFATSPTLVTPALGTPASGTLTNCSFPTLNQNTTGSAATLTTGRTIGMTGDVVWTSASFNGSGNVTGSSVIQAGAVDQSMLAAAVKGYAEDLDNDTTGIARTYDAGAGTTTYVITMSNFASMDSRKVMVEVLLQSDFSTVFPCVTRATDGTTLTLLFNGEITDDTYRILMKQVG